MTRTSQSAVSAFGWALFVALLFGCPDLAKAGRLPYNLVSSNGPLGVFVLPVDANNDGVDELLRASPSQITMLTQNEQYAWDRKNTDSLMRYSPGAFSTNDTGKGQRLIVVPARDARGPAVDSLFGSSLFYVGKVVDGGVFGG